MMTSICPLCRRDDEDVLWESGRCRVILAREPDHPAYCRVIWHTHVREMTDLAPAEREYYMRVVFGVEDALRAVVRPDKINLASLGNVVPHLHWHVIARFADDAHFPDSVWAEKKRAGERRSVDMARLGDVLAQRLAWAT
jgi:diadenosine tetraphosphate (Ap4A) HIT family hydrolase